MWISSEDARSDFILAAAAVFLGVQLVSLLSSIPGYPLTGTVGQVVALGWLVLLACGAPYALARYRNQVPAAFGLGPEDRGRLSVGLVVGAPLLVGYLLSAVVSGDLRDMLLALAGRLVVQGPALGGFQWGLDTVLSIVAVVVVAAGSAITGAFLAVRARDAFRSPDMDLTELLRTFGLGAVGLSFVMGLLAVMRDGGSFLGLLVRTLALFTVVLLVDRYVPPRIQVPRAAIIGPAIAVLVLWVIAFGGPFRGDLLIGLTAGTASGALLVAAAALLTVRQGLAAAVLLAASVIYPVGSYPLHPLPFLG